MSILFACPHCHATKSHHEPISDRVNVRACPECRKFFHLWWTVRDARMFGIAPVTTSVMLGYPGTKSESSKGFAQGGFTSENAWRDEGNEFFFGQQSPFFKFDPNAPRYEQEATFNFDKVDDLHTAQILQFMEALKKARFNR